MRKPDVTTLGYALLGLLARESLSGYDLAQRLKVPVGFFWRARHSQIYPELGRLEAMGLVTHRLIEQQDRPDKKLYTITDAGRAKLRDWAMAPLAGPTPRDELVLKAYSLWLAAPDQAKTLFREQEQRHMERLAQYEGFRADLARHPDVQILSSPMFATYATLLRGIGYEREYAAWCRWVAEQLEQASDGSGGAP